MLNLLEALKLDENKVTINYIFKKNFCWKLHFFKKDFVEKFCKTIYLLKYLRVVMI